MNETEEIPLTTKSCPGCKSVTIINVKKQDYESWKNGKTIQSAFPYLKRDERERLLTGYCSKCYDEEWG